MRTLRTLRVLHAAQQRDRAARERRRGRCRVTPAALCRNAAPRGIPSHASLRAPAPPRAGTLYADFPIAGVFVCLGVYIMFITERLSIDAMADQENLNCEQLAPGAVVLTDLEAPHGGCGDGEDAHEHEHLSALAGARAIASQHAGHAHDGKAGHGHAHAHEEESAQLSGKPHAHDSDSVDADAAPALTDAKLRRRVMTARLLEISIVVHSFIIGLNLGTGSGHHHGEGAPHEEEVEEEPHRRLLRRLLATSSTTTETEHHDEHAEEEAPSLRPIVALIVVLCFHQAFEGIALGSYIAELRGAATAAQKGAMAALFALTVPVGCWVGIGVASSYSPESQTAVWVTGTLNGVTGGMLLYTSLITFMGEEFSRSDLGGREGRAVKRRMYACMLLGAAAMALLAIWA